MSRDTRTPAEPGGTPSARPRRTILAPLPDETPPTGGPEERRDALPPAAHRAPPPREAAAPTTDGHPRRAQREEKPSSTTKAYLWRRNVSFIDSLVIKMEDHGARAGDINRSVVLRAAVTALEQAGMGGELARCADEEQLTQLITDRLRSSEC